MPISFPCPHEGRRAYSHSFTLFLPRKELQLFFYMSMPCAMKSKLRLMIEVRGMFMLLNVLEMFHFKESIYILSY